MTYIGIIVIYAASAYFLFGSADFPSSAAVFPRSVAIFLAILNTLFLVSTIREGKKADSATRSFAVVLGASLVYTVLLKTVGFLILTPLFVGGIMYYLGARNRFTIVLTALIVTVSIYFGFRELFSIPVPAGFFA